MPRAREKQQKKPYTKPTVKMLFDWEGELVPFFAKLFGL
jgi:hypothetical protein